MEIPLPHQQQQLSTPGASAHYPVLLAMGRPFSFDQLDVSLPLAKLAARLHSSVDRISHFGLRLDHYLPVLLDDGASQERRIAAAYLCHQPYRDATSEFTCHPFRQVLCSVLAATASMAPALCYALEILLSGSERNVQSLGMESPQQLVQAHSLAAGPSSGISSRLAELVRKATIQTLSMGEQKVLVSALGVAHTETAAADGTADADRLPPVWLTPLIEPEHLILMGANSPMITCEMVGRLCQEAITANGSSGGGNDGDDSQSLSTPAILVHRYLEAMQKLPPTLRSFDLVTRLLRSERPAPAPIEHLQTSPSRPVELISTVAHASRLQLLGGFLSNSVRHLERRESDEETAILSEAHEAGLPEPTRREVEDMLENRISREVSIFCHFVRCLIIAALLLPPDLGVVRRRVSELKEGGDAEQARYVEGQLEAMEVELESNTQAMLVELQHFALHFGRYRDGTRLYGELTSLA